MGSKINIQAKIKRHSRILKESLSNWIKHKLHYNYGYNFVLLVVVFLLPIYPALASFVHNNTVLDFYRGDIDESSILESYIADDMGENSTGLVVETKDSFLSINTLLDDERDISNINEIIDYEVKSGESIASIAQRFGISYNTLYWANNLNKNSTLHPGDIIKVPPVSWLVHTVKSWDTLSVIAKKYDIDIDNIRKQNNLSASDTLIAGKELVIPWAVKKYEAPKVIPQKTTKTYYASSSAQKKWEGSSYSFVNESSSEYVNTDGVYKLVKRAPQHTFYWWNCTRFVAQYKNVNWGGNAKDWLKNARANGHSTWSSPSLWAIVVFNGKGYNPRYWHVGIVVEVQQNNIIVKDMNYRRINEVTTRKVSKSDGAIIGYIYVD